MQTPHHRNVAAQGSLESNRSPPKPVHIPLAEGSARVDGTIVTTHNVDPAKAFPLDTIKGLESHLNNTIMGGVTIEIRRLKPFNNLRDPVLYRCNLLGASKRADVICERGTRITDVTKAINGKVAAYTRDPNSGVQANPASLQNYRRALSLPTPNTTGVPQSSYFPPIRPRRENNPPPQRRA